jgi:hypothetical protein
MRKQLRVRGKQAVHRLGQIRAGLRHDELEALTARVTELESEMQEARRLNLRLAELTDVVQELLLPDAQRDEEKFAEAMERYTMGV